MIVMRLRQHLNQIADLPVCPQIHGADNQMDRTLREFHLQSANKLDSWIIRLADAKNHFIFGIVEQAVTAEALVHLGIGAFERLEDGNWRKLLDGSGIPARSLSIL